MVAVAGHDFGPDFVWGTATAAYQIEGAYDKDGRGPSIWDTFSHTPGRVVNGDTGDVACDHYHRWRTDVDLMAELGVNGYRFSISWSRLLPTGNRADGVNPAGIDFYRRLIEALLEHDIQPFITLYHWDLPQALEDLGGWRSRDTAYRFAEYAALCAESFGDLGPRWITLNEPYCSSITGYAEGRHAPGAHEGHGALAAVHHLLLGHGLATRELRRVNGAQVGLTLNMSPAVAISGAPADLAAARRQDLLVNRLFTEPVLGRAYPADAAEVFGAITDFSFRHDGDLDIIAEPLDFLGVNYYYRVHVRDAPFREAPATRTAYDIAVSTQNPSGVPTSGLGWPIEPQGLTATLTGLRTRFEALPPVYVTENGCAYPDEVGADGGVADPARISFISAHVAAMADAVAAGVDLRGYFHWSLIDNFEWARGYAPRFGLIHVDYTTQVRTPKASYHWLRRQLRP
jgi:beta-glucosidase